MKIKVLIVEVGRAPKVTMIENTLTALQEIVGGFIEMVGLDTNEPICGFCNEEGKLIPLAQNRLLYREGIPVDVIHGNFLVCGVDREGDCISLTDAQCEVWANHFKLQN